MGPAVRDRHGLLTRERTEPYLEASARAGTGDVHRGTGDHEAARQAWAAALRIFNGIDHPDGDEVRARLG